MKSNHQIYRRYIWLINTIYSAGSISREEIEQHWLHSSQNDEHSQLDRRTFFRDRDAIEEIWGIEIVCDRRTNRFSLRNMGDLGEGGLQTWMADSLAIQNMIGHAEQLRERVIFERIPAGKRFMNPIMSAICEGRKLRMTYQRFDRPEPHSFLLEPYCMKVFKQRWYVIGKPEDHPEELDPRVYALDRVIDMELTDERYRPNKHFRADRFFRDYYGVDRREKPVDIRIRVKTDAANYLRSLPIHHSQQEVSRLSDCSEFTMHVAPTYDFIQELRKHGSNLEVLAPKELRERMAEEARLLAEMY